MPRTKPNIVKIITIVLSTLIAIYGAVFLLGRHYLNSSEINNLLTEQIESKLNRKVAFDKDLKFKISWDMAPLIQIKNIKISNFSESSATVMLSIEQLDIKFHLLYLLFKELRIAKIVLSRPILHLETSNNKNNWSFADTKHKPSSKAGNLSIDEISIKNGIINYQQDKAIATQIKLSSVKFEANARRVGFRFNLNGSYEQTPLYLIATAEVNTNQIKLDINKLHIGNSTLNGKLLISDNYKSISGELYSELINIKDFTQKNNKARTNISDEYKIPDLELPPRYLQDLEINLPITIKSLNMGTVTLADIGIYINAQDNILNIALKPSLNFASDQIGININYNLQHSSPILDAKITGNSLLLESILNIFIAKSPIIESNLDIQADLHSTGSKLNELVQNLNGHILATASAGKYIAKHQANSDLKCAVMNFHVHNGIATANNGLGIEATNVNVLGDGKIDLNNGRINFSIKPQNISNDPLDINQYSLANFVEIAGTIKKPQISLNPINLVNPTKVIAKDLLSKLAGMPDTSVAGTSGTEIDSPCKAAIES